VAHYLITGAAGFIGARQAEVLLSQGNNITGVDNLNDDTT
jgi:nucleoside-diphosphate-sugar epimerase